MRSGIQILLFPCVPNDKNNDFSDSVTIFSKANSDLFLPCILI